MANIKGIYRDDTAAEPKRIEVRGSEDEIRYVLSNPQLDFRYVGPKHPWTVDIPADKDRVREIAKHIELDCDDQRLIDWMKA